MAYDFPDGHPLSAASDRRGRRAGFGWGCIAVVVGATIVAFIWGRS